MVEYFLCTWRIFFTFVRFSLEEFHLFVKFYILSANYFLGENICKLLGEQKSSEL